LCCRDRFYVDAMINQLFSIRLFFAFDTFSLNFWKYYWWKFFINSLIWTSSTYIHWFSTFDQSNYLIKYCNLFRYNLLFNINFTSSCFFSFIMIKNYVIISSNRLLNDFNKKTWKTLCIRNVWNKLNLYVCFSTRSCISNDS
jgi:hypothetical protein